MAGSGDPGDIYYDEKGPGPENDTYQDTSDLPPIQEEKSPGPEAVENGKPGTKVGSLKKLWERPKSTRNPVPAAANQKRMSRQVSSGSVIYEDMEEGYPLYEETDDIVTSGTSQPTQDQAHQEAVVKIGGTSQPRQGVSQELKEHVGPTQELCSSRCLQITGIVALFVLILLAIGILIVGVYTHFAILKMIQEQNRSRNGTSY